MRGSRGVGDLDAHVAGVQPLGRARQHAGAAAVALDGDDLARALHQRGQVGALAARRRAQVEHPLAGLRVRACATTSIAARDWAMNAPPAATAASRARRRAPRARAPRAMRGSRWAATGSARRRASRRRSTSVFARSATSPGSLSAAISARACSAPSCPHHSSRDPLGMGVLQRRLLGRVVGEPRQQRRRPLAGGAAQDRVDEPVTARAVVLGELDGVARRPRSRGALRGRAARTARGAAPPAAAGRGAPAGASASSPIRWSSVARRCTAP